MARPLRIQYPGAVYHITTRGNERKDIFRDEVDRKTFLRLLAISKKIYSIKIYSYVLMPNHFHLLIETPLGNLSEFMRHFNITYTSHYNRRHKRTGHLYQGRYKSILVDKDAYLNVLSRYIHMNPVKVKGMKKLSKKEKMNYLRSYRWSSLPGYISKRRKEQFVDYALVLEEYGGDNDKGRKAYQGMVSLDLSSRFDIKDEIVGQSILGREEFVDWVWEHAVKEDKDRRERPALRELQSYKSGDEIIQIIEGITGKSLEEIKKEKGYQRYIVMDVLYRVGGMKGVEIGKIMGVDYSTVSQGRKRLQEKMSQNKKVKRLVHQVERKLSQ